MTGTAFQPIFGSLSEIFGRRIFIHLAIVLFSVGALLAGTANNVLRLLLGRALQGVGGGGLITLTGVIIADFVPLKKRAKYFGILSAMWALGSVIGPVIGGCFAERSTWVNRRTQFEALIWLTLSSALDLLYQLPVHWHCGCSPCTLFPTSARHRQLLDSAQAS